MPPLDLTCTSDEKISVAASPTTKTGSPATLDGALVVTVTSGDGTVSQDPASPLSFFCVSGTAIADTVYNVKGDADLGAGVVTIEDIVTLHVVSPLAQNLGLGGGTPVPKP